MLSGQSQKEFYLFKDTIIQETRNGKLPNIPSSLSSHCQKKYSIPCTTQHFILDSSK